MTRRTRPRLLVLPLITLLAAFTLTACTPEQQATIDLINQSRVDNGLPELQIHLSLLDKAQAWAELLASEGGLRHSNLPDGVTGNWTRLGENVGRGPSIEAVHEAYMASTGHRANILDPNFNFVGSGHAIGADGAVYTVHVFARY